MTPKDKAEELVYKYRLLDLKPQDYNNFDFNLTVSNSKQCALICADKMHEAIEHFYGQDKEVSSYIEEIKDEIIKL